MSAIKRHKCCKCGRKRMSIYLERNFMKQHNWQYKPNWCNYPRIDSYKCKENCLPYTGDVQVTSDTK